MNYSLDLSLGPKKSSKDKSELHLIIIWENARHKEKDIIADISSKFELISVYHVHWEEPYFSNSLSRFYGANIPADSNKARNVGNGEFLVLTFYDNKPKYEIVETARGMEKVNINVFDSKMKYRQWAKGKDIVHGTNDILETDQNLTLLFGINYNDYKVLVDQGKQEEIKIPTAAIGSKEWESLDQFFYVINSYINYVVLRNFEELPKISYTEEHGDIDLLVENLEDAKLISNAEQIIPKSKKVIYKGGHHLTKINGSYVDIDFTYVGDNYFDRKWQNDILANKVSSKKGIYHPCLNDHFYGLIYHILAHKRMISPDYEPKLSALYNKINPGPEKQRSLDDFLFPLIDYMDEKGYHFVKPLNLAGFFFDALEGSYVNHIDFRSIYKELGDLGIKNVSPYRLSSWNKKYPSYIYFTGTNEEGKTCFIKYGGLDNSVSREHAIMSELEGKFFPRVYFYRYINKHKLVVMEKIDGVPLSKIDFLTLNDKSKAKICLGLYEILKILRSKNLIHRDIRPDNIMVLNDFTPVLIDFEHAVDSKRKRFKEYKMVRKNPKLIRSLGAEYAKNRFHWDDAYSISKILAHHDFGGSKTVREVKENISRMVGEVELISMKKGSFRRTARRIWNIIFPIYFTTYIFIKRRIRAIKRLFIK